MVYGGVILENLAMSNVKARMRKSVRIRTSVSLDRADLDQIAQIARRKKVSKAWVIREAVERYLEDRTPLFKSGVE